MVLLALGFVAYGYMSINVGLPAYPTLAKVFGVPETHIKLSMTVFLLGYALSQLCWGSLSDHFGRRKIALLATLITIVGSFVTSFAASLWFFMLGRFVEAIGAGFATVVARALLVDSFEGKKLKHSMSYIVMMAALMPSIAPIIGGNLLHLFNWHVIYIFLGVLGVVLLWLERWQMPETLPPHTNRFSLRHIGVSLRSLLTHRQFLGYLLSYGF